MANKKNDTSKIASKQRKLSENITAYDGVNKAGKRITVVKVSDTSTYAQIKVAKRLGLIDKKDISFIAVSNANTDNGAHDELEKALSLSTLRMSDCYSGTVTCHDDKGDKYNEVTGSDLAQEKAFKNMREAAKSRITQWQIKMIKKIRAAEPETFDAALERAVKDIKESSAKQEAKKEKLKNEAKADTKKTTRKRKARPTIKSSDIIDNVKTVTETIKTSFEKKSTRKTKTTKETAKAPAKTEAKTASKAPKTTKRKSATK